MLLFKRKLKEKNGESLLEALFAILVIAITSSLLLMYVQSSSKINSDAKAAFVVFGDEMSAAEAQLYQAETTVTINGTVRTVKYSGNIEENELHSYWR